MYRSQFYLSNFQSSAKKKKMNMQRRSQPEMKNGWKPEIWHRYDTRANKFYKHMTQEWHEWSAWKFVQWHRNDTNILPENLSNDTEMTRECDFKSRVILSTDTSMTRNHDTTMTQEWHRNDTIFLHSGYNIYNRILSIFRFDITW